MQFEFFAIPFTNDQLCSSKAIMLRCIHLLINMYTVFIGVFVVVDFCDSLITGACINLIDPIIACYADLLTTTIFIDTLIVIVGSDYSQFHWVINRRALLTYRTLSPIWFDRYREDRVIDWYFNRDVTNGKTIIVKLLKFQISNLAVPIYSQIMRTIY